MNDETGNGCRFIVRQTPVHLPVQVADRDRAIDVHSPIGLRADVRFMGVVLVRDLADDFFQDVFKRDQALHFAVFIDDQRHLGFFLQELIKLIFQAGGVGHKPRRRREAHHVKLRRVPAGLRQRRQQILGVQNADNVFRLVLPHWGARVLRF